MTKKRGKLITFEGIDGCGKTTQLSRTARYLRKQGFKVKTLREPGSTRLAERIRTILLDRKQQVLPITELLLYEAARAELTAREIAPLLAAGTIVLCDRFYDSTTAYQGYGRKIDIPMIRKLHRVAVGRVKPDLTFVFDVTLRVAYERRGEKPDRLESESRAFFSRVRSGYKNIAHREPHRVKLIPANAEPGKVFELLLPHLRKSLSIK
jgi:dTMP kinase